MVKEMDEDSKGNCKDEGGNISKAASEDKHKHDSEDKGKGGHKNEGRR